MLYIKQNLSFYYMLFTSLFYAQNPLLFEIAESDKSLALGTSMEFTSSTTSSYSTSASTSTTTLDYECDTDELVDLPLNFDHDQITMHSMTMHTMHTMTMHTMT